MTLCYIGTQLPPQKGGGDPSQFLAHVCCGQTAGWIKMALGMEVGRGQVHTVLDGGSAPVHKMEQSPPQFSAHFYYGQTAGCVKMPLGMEVGLIPAHFVLDGDPAQPPLQKWAEPPNLWPTCIVAKRLHGSRCQLVRR